MTKNNYVNKRIRLTYRTILLPKIESDSRFKSEPGASSTANLEFCPTVQKCMHGPHYILRNGTELASGLDRKLVEKEIAFLKSNLLNSAKRENGLLENKSG